MVVKSYQVTLKWLPFSSQLLSLNLHFRLEGKGDKIEGKGENVTLEWFGSTQEAVKSKWPNKGHWLSRCCFLVSSGEETDMGLKSSEWPWRGSFWDGSGAGGVQLCELGSAGSESHPVPMFFREWDRTHGKLREGLDEHLVFCGGLVVTGVLVSRGQLKVLLLPHLVPPSVVGSKPRDFLGKIWNWLHSTEGKGENEHTGPSLQTGRWQF